jgi:hypothetical protein
MKAAGAAAPGSRLNSRRLKSLLSAATLPEGNRKYFGSLLVGYQSPEGFGLLAESGPRMVYQSHFRGEYVSMNKRGRTRMLLVLLLPWQAYGNIRNRNIGPLVSVIRTVGSVGSRRRRQTIRRRSRLLKSSNGQRRPSGHLNKSKMFWTGCTKRFPANALFEQLLENI